MPSDKNTIAWAIAVRTIPFLEDLHGEHRCWKKGESPVPEYLYFDVLLLANEVHTENPTFIKPPIRYVEWILQQRNFRKSLDILSHLCSPQFLTGWPNVIGTEKTKSTKTFLSGVLPFIVTWYTRQSRQAGAVSSKPSVHIS